MSDNLHRYRAIREALTQWYPGQPTGTVATKIPDGTKPESRVKRLTRWLDNERVLEEVYFLPYVNLLLAQ